MRSQKQFACQVQQTPPLLAFPGFDVDLVDDALWLLKRGINLDDRAAVLASLDAHDRYPDGYYDAVIELARHSTAAELDGCLGYWISRSNRHRVISPYGTMVRMG